MSHSTDEEELLDYLYSLEEADFNELGILDDVRALVSSNNDSIRELAMLRLACRAKDQTIYEKCLEIMWDSHEANSVFAAAVRSAVCLATNSNRQSSLLSELRDLSCQQDDPIKLKVLSDAISDLRKSSGYIGYLLYLARTLLADNFGRSAGH